MGFVQEFKEFALKGNVVDLAVGVIIGAAFGAIVTSVVNDVLMPPLGWLAGGLDFGEKAWVIQSKGEAHKITGNVLKDDVVLRYGRFINAIITFTLMAVAIFVMIKLMNRLRRKEAAQPAPPPGPTPDQKLLTEIRDLLRERRV
jgi:large conductance mechanosensitive channel